MATTLRDLRARQERVIRMIAEGSCSISCGAAVHTDGDCHCRCSGLNHGALWIDEIAAVYDRAT